MQSKLTLLHSSRQLKQNWCMHESVKHLLFTRPKQIEQFGGGDWLACCRCCSSPLLPDSVASRLDGVRCSWCFFKNSRIREFGCDSARGGGVSFIVPIRLAAVFTSTVGGHSIANSAIFVTFTLDSCLCLHKKNLLNFQKMFLLFARLGVTFNHTRNHFFFNFLKYTLNEMIKYLYFPSTP